VALEFQRSRDNVLAEMKRHWAAGHRKSVPLGVVEVALTAITIEALAPLVVVSARTRAAVARACRFLERWQFRPGCVPAALDPAYAEGAFPLSPIASFSRGDVTAHAALALHRASLDR
jgi:hypothetical protein